MAPAKLNATSSMKTAIRFITSPNGTSCSDFTPGRSRAAPEGVTSVIRMTRRAAAKLMYCLRLPRHVIHQQILPERIRRCEVCLAPAHLRHFLDELHQPVIRCQHESINQHPRAFALRNFFERLTDDQRIKPESVLIDASVFECQCRRLAVCDHDDLLH